MICETRCYPSLEEAQTQYETLDLWAQASQLMGDRFQMSVFIMNNLEETEFYVAVVGDEADVQRASKRWEGGEPFELPAEHMEAMFERRRRLISGADGSYYSRHDYEHGGWLRRDGSIKERK